MGSAIGSWVKMVLSAAMKGWDTLELHQPHVAKTLPRRPTKTERVVLGRPILQLKVSFAIRIAVDFLKQAEISKNQQREHEFPRKRNPPPPFSNSLKTSLASTFLSEAFQTSAQHSTKLPSPSIYLPLKPQQVLTTSSVTIIAKKPSICNNKTQVSSFGKTVLAYALMRIATAMIAQRSIVPCHSAGV